MGDRPDLQLLGYVTLAKGRAPSLFVCQRMTSVWAVVGSAYVRLSPKAHFNAFNATLVRLVLLSTIPRRIPWAACDPTLVRLAQLVNTSATAASASFNPTLVRLAPHFL